MRVTAVSSTTLTTVVYDEAREVLQLEFRSRAIYQYWGVPRAVHEALLGAPSKGLFFNQAIRRRFPFCRISRSQAPVPEVPTPDRA
ncbi:MAG TPA: KTSC domain-containing protein [Terriglobales bacterium]|nr:KTSC domain-containing protein [Terriglobales bacterium]